MQFLLTLVHNMFADIGLCRFVPLTMQLTKYKYLRVNYQLFNLYWLGIELSELIHLSTRYVTNRTIVSCPQ